MCLDEWIDASYGRKERRKSFRSDGSPDAVRIFAWRLTPHRTGPGCSVSVKEFEGDEPRFGMGAYRKLRVWREAHAMAVGVDRIAKRIRGSANSALRNQMIRSALSVPTNIVEGRAQRTEKDFARFLNYALGSSEELDYHLLVAKDVQAISEHDYRQSAAALAEVRKMLRGLIKKIQTRPAPSE